MINERGELEFALPQRKPPSQLDFSGMTDRQKTELYLRMVNAIADIVSGNADNSCLDSSDQKECYDEFQNVIFSLRQQWKAV